MILPTRELLSTVLKQDITNVGMITDTRMYLSYGKDINIYKLMHLIKVWGKEHNYNLFSGLRVKSNALCTVFYRYSEVDEEWDFEGDVEFDSVVMAGEWVLARLNNNKEAWNAVDSDIHAQPNTLTGEIS